MNIGAFGENFPYSNFHDLNTDWIIKIAKDFLDQYTSIEGMITQGIEDISSKIDTGLSDIEAETLDSLTNLQDKYTEISGLLDTWYNTHSEDIATQLTNAITTFNTTATTKGEQVLESIPDDYTALVAEVNNIYKMMSLTYTVGLTRLDNSFYTIEDALINGTGIGTSTFNGYYTTQYIPIVSPYAHFVGNAFPAEAYNSFVLYDASFNVLYRAHGAFDVYMSEYPTAKYFRASRDNATPSTYYVEIDNNQYEGIAELSRLFTTNGALPTSLLVNENQLMEGDGTTVDSFSGYNLSDFIPIFNRNIHFYGDYFPSAAYTTFALYDETLTPVFVATGKQHVNLENYPTAMYMRFGDSTANTYPSYIGVGTDHIRFEIGADKFYTTLKSGIGNAIKFNYSDVTVYSGTYDLATEFASEIALASGSIGIQLDKYITVNFMAGSYVQALFPTSNTYISTYFQPFYGKNFTLNNLNIEASNCRYCVHDEQASSPYAYKNVYNNCKMKFTCNASSGATFIVTQCIGGGLGEHGVIEINGGNFYSDGDNMTHTGTENAVISYHNGTSANCDNRITIKDAYIDGFAFGRIVFGYYGSSTTKTLVTVSNCHMGDTVLVKAETPDATNNNFEVLEFNNRISRQWISSATTASHTLSPQSSYILMVVSTNANQYGMWLINTTSNAVYTYEMNKGSDMSISLNGLEVTLTHPARTVRTALIKLH